MAASSSQSISILFTNIGDNAYGQGLCSTQNKTDKEYNNIIQQQNACAAHYFKTNADFILLQEVCADTYFNNIKPPHHYTTYAAPHKPTTYYFDQSYKFNIIFSNDNAVTFQKDVVEQDVKNTCIINKPQQLYMRKAKTQYHKATLDNPEVLKEYTLSADKNLIIRYNWVNINNIYPQTSNICMFYDAQFGIYTIGSFTLLLVNVHIANPARPHPKTPPATYEKEFNHVLSNVKRFANKHHIDHVIIAGDFNIYCVEKSIGVHCNIPGIEYMLNKYKYKYNVALAKNMGVLYSHNVRLSPPYYISPPCVKPPTMTTTIYKNHPMLHLHFVLSDEYVVQNPIDLHAMLYEKDINIDEIPRTIKVDGEHYSYVDLLVELLALLSKTSTTIASSPTNHPATSSSPTTHTTSSPKSISSAISTDQIDIQKKDIVDDPTEEVPWISTTKRHQTRRKQTKNSNTRKL